jgi:hypothetical protein
VTCSIATIGTVTDVDFRDIRVSLALAGRSLALASVIFAGTSVSRSRTPKNGAIRIGTGNWSDDQWSDTVLVALSSTDNFPLAQDTAVFDESTTGWHSHDGTTPSVIDVSGIDMSARTSALTLSLSTRDNVFMANWTFGSGITLTGAQTNVASTVRNTQVITSAGKTFSGGIAVDLLRRHSRTR